MTTVLVTGATGFIGKFLVSHLLDQKVSIRALIRYAKQDIFHDAVEQWIGDLTNPSSLVGIANDIDIVFHLGAYAHTNSDEEKHQRVNVRGTQFLLEECVRAGVKKFILFSTIKAVGHADHCIDEQWDALPVSPYGKAKRAAEVLALAVGEQYNMHVCVLRLALVYGPGVKGNLYQMLRAIDKGYFLAIPPVNNYRSLVNVYDVCQAAWLATQCEVANGKIYFVADDEPYSTYQIYTSIYDVLNYTVPRWHIPFWVFKIFAWIGDQGERCLHRRLPFNSQTLQKLFGSAQCSSQRIQRELGFSQRYLLRTVLEEAVQVYREGRSSCMF